MVANVNSWAIAYGRCINSIGGGDEYSPKIDTTKSDLGYSVSSLLDRNNMNPWIIFWWEDQGSGVTYRDQVVWDTLPTWTAILPATDTETIIIDYDKWWIITVDPPKMDGNFTANSKKDKALGEWANSYKNTLHDFNDSKKDSLVNRAKRKAKVTYEDWYYYVDIWGFTFVYHENRL